MNRTLFLLLALTAPVPGQKVPLAGEDPRILQIRDVSDLIGPWSAFDREGKGEKLDGLAEFFREFLEPPLTESEDLEAMGDRYLVLLGHPEQHAWLEQALVRAREAKLRQFFLDVKILRIGEAVYRRHFTRLNLRDEGGQRTTILLSDHDGTHEWLAGILKDKEVEILQAPKIVPLNLQPCQLSVGAPMRYVKDYEVEHVQDRSVLRPVLGELFRGVRMRATCGHLDRNDVGIAFSFEKTEVTEPVPRIETTLASGDEVEIDLPHSRSLFLRQVLRLPEKGMAVVVGAKTRDRYPVILVTVSRLKD